MKLAPPDLSDFPDSFLAQDAPFCSGTFQSLLFLAYCAIDAFLSDDGALSDNQLSLTFLFPHFFRFLVHSLQRVTVLGGRISASSSAVTTVPILSAIRSASTVATSPVSVCSSSSSAAERSFRQVSSIPVLPSQFTRAFAAPAAAQGNVGDVIAFPLADIGEGIAECEVLKWFIKPGDTIAQFQKVCEVQSDKANVEITSRYDGVVQQIMYEVGQMAAVGKPLFTIKLTTATAGAAAKSGGAAAAAAASSSAASASAPASSSSAPSSSTSSAIRAVPRNNSDVLASPVVRRMAAELGIELGRVNATGTKGQISKEDLLAYHAAVTSGAAPAPAASAAPTSSSSCAFASAQAAPAPSASASAPPVSSSSAPADLPKRSGSSAAADRQVQVTGIQKVMVKTMTAAAAIPTFGFADEINVTNLMRLRKHTLTIAAKHNLKPSYFAFILKAMSVALNKYPMVNSHVNADCTAFTIKGSHNIGLAMDTPKGLLVPNIKNVQNLSVLEIAAELARLQALGKASITAIFICGHNSIVDLFHYSSRHSPLRLHLDDKLTSDNYWMTFNIIFRV